MSDPVTYYDPPSGHRYGFPKPYAPQPGESILDTLVRDGYPREDAEQVASGAWPCRFWQVDEEQDR